MRRLVSVIKVDGVVSRNSTAYLRRETEGDRKREEGEGERGGGRSRDDPETDIYAHLSQETLKRGTLKLFRK